MSDIVYRDIREAQFYGEHQGINFVLIVMKVSTGGWEFSLRFPPDNTGLDCGEFTDWELGFRETMDTARREAEARV